MNNHNPHNHNEQRPDERPFAYILKRALLPQQDESIDTAQHMSAIPEYQITTQARINMAQAGIQSIGVASTRSARR